MAEGTPIESLQIQIEATASSAEKSLEDLKKSVELLKSALSGTGLTGLVKELKNVEATTNELGTTSAASIEKLVQALKDLQGVGKLNLDYTAKELDTVNKASERAVSSTTGWGKRIIAAAVSLKTIGHTIASFIDKSNAYVENLNLFNVSLGEYAESAKQYAEQVGTLMGIDPSAWMRNQGVFQILATGFGVASDRAYIMSKNLTQLGYDLSSFFNIAVEGEGGAMQKLQAAISGELEPLRRLGFDLSEARLKAVALSLGIDQTFNSMTQAQKAQLRYYTILNQVTEAQGDMARTLETPANQLRILKAQAEQAARSLGNIFIPALNAIIPYVNAAIQAIRMLADIIADFFHFELPTVDYSNIDGATNAVDSLDTALQSAGGSAKKLNELLADWDELNIIQSESGGGGSGGASAYNTDDWSFELPEYNFLKDFVETKVTSIMEKIKPYISWVEDHIKEIMRFAEGIGAAFVGWKLASKLIPDITEAASLLTNLFAVVLEGAIITGTVVLNIDLTTNWLETGNWGSIAGEAIATIAGSSLAAALIRHIIGGEKGAIMADWAAGTVLTVNAGVGLFLALEDIKTKGFNYKNIVKLLEASLEASAGMALIARGIGKAITGRSASLGEMLGFVATAFFFTVGATMNIALNKSVLEGDPEALVEQAGISIAEALGVGVSLGLTTGSVTVGAAAAAIAFSANAVLNFVTALGDVTKNGITDANVMALIANSLGATVGIGALVGILTGSLGWAVVAGVLTLTLAATAFVIVKELTVNADKSMVPHWGTRSLTEQEINDKVNGMFGFDVDATITTINAIVDANAKVNLDTKTASEKLGKELTAWLMDLNSTEALDQIHVSLFGEATEEGELDPNSLLGKFKAELSSAREQAVSWFTTANGAGSEGSVTLLELMNLSDEMIFEGVEAAGQEWGRLFKEGFTDETKDLGMQLLKLIYDVTSAGELGAIQADYEMSVMDFTLADLDEKSIQKLFADFDEKEQNLMKSLVAAEDSTTKNLKVEMARYEAFIKDMRDIYGEDYDLTEYENMLTELQTQYSYRMLHRGEEAEAKWKELTSAGRTMFAKALADQLGFAEYEAVREYAEKNYPSIWELMSMGYIGDLPFETQQIKQPDVTPFEETVSNFPMQDWMYDTTVYDEYSDSVEDTAEAVTDLSKSLEDFERVQKRLQPLPEFFETDWYYDPALGEFYDLLVSLTEQADTMFAEGTDLMGYQRLIGLINTGSKALKFYLKGDQEGGDAWMKAFENSLKAYNELTTPVEINIDTTEAQNSISALQTQWNNLINSMHDIGYASGITVTVNYTPYYNIPEFATGGMPETGELFVAREAGPEMVGRIGRSTAVANNEQIESGIASGVREAQQDQNELLRQQNKLLTAILRKTGHLEPSTALARTLKRSNELMAVADGI